MTPSRNIRRPTAAGRSRNSSRPPRKPTFRLFRRSHCRTRWLRALTTPGAGRARQTADALSRRILGYDEPAAAGDSAPDLRRVRRAPRSTTSRTLPATLRRTPTVRRAGRPGDPAPDAWGQDEPAAPSGGAPDAFGRGGLGSPDRDSPGFYGRGEPADSGNDLSGDADTPVSGFHAMIRLPRPRPPSGHPRPPIGHPHPAGRHPHPAHGHPRPASGSSGRPVPPGPRRLRRSGSPRPGSGTSRPVRLRPAGPCPARRPRPACAGTARHRASGPRQLTQATAVRATAVRATAPGAAGPWPRPGSRTRTTTGRTPRSARRSPATR